MSAQIWQCVSCGCTFPEYVNGCPHHGEGVETAPRGIRHWVDLADRLTREAALRAVREDEDDD